MNKTCLLLTAGLVAGIFAAGNAAAATDSGQGGESHPGWKMVNAGEGHKVPVRTYESWSRAYARVQGHEASSNGGHGYAAHRAGSGYTGWGYGGYGMDFVDAVSGLAMLGALRVADPYGYGYGYPGRRYAYSCVQTRWDPVAGYVRVPAPC
ncbi:MAG: hypothetical protein ACLPX9_22470 [Rhodomicrobium sp.]